MVHTGFARSRSFSAWLGTFLFLLFCQTVFMADALAEEPEKKATRAEQSAPAGKEMAGEEDGLGDLLELRSNADAGDVSAQFELGRRYFKGNGFEQNDEEAVRWLSLAAQGGLPKAQAGLGWMYAAGRGVKKDDTQSFLWYERAAVAGLPVAQYMLGRCYETGVGVKKDRYLAKEWYEKASAQGNEKAKKRLQEWK